MHRAIHVNLYSGDGDCYVAEAVHLPVVTQGKTVEETLANLREALTVHLEGVDLEKHGIHRGAPVDIRMEMDPIHVQH